MLRESLRGAVAIAATLVVACGSVSGSDPAFWQAAPGIAGAQVQFVPNPGGGAAGTPTPTDTNGNPIPPPPGSGGAPNGGVPNFGGAPSAGTPNFGGAPSAGTPNFGGFPTSTGGDPNVGGFPTSTGGDPNVGGFPTGTGGDPNVPPPPPPTPGQSCNFTFNVTTVSYGGRFRPKNVGAIYIENGSGGYVKSLNVWGATRLSNLTDWSTLSGGDKTDAVTSATRSSAGPISGHWDCTDKNRSVVPSGQYKACCSFQEDDALPFFGPAPKQACVPFNLPGAPGTTNAPDQQYFTNMTLTFQ